MIGWVLIALGLLGLAIRLLQELDITTVLTDEESPFSTGQVNLWIVAALLLLGGLCLHWW